MNKFTPRFITMSQAYVYDILHHRQRDACYLCGETTFLIPRFWSPVSALSPPNEFYAHFEAPADLKVVVS